MNGESFKDTNDKLKWHLGFPQPAQCDSKTEIKTLTGVAHVDAVVHDVTQHGHDDAKQGEEDPVFADPGERVPPDKRGRVEQSGSPLATVSSVHQFVSALFILFLALLLALTQF